MLGMETRPWYSPDELVNMFKQASLKPDFVFFFSKRKAKYDWMPGICSKFWLLPIGILWFY